MIPRCQSRRVLLPMAFAVLAAGLSFRNAAAAFPAVGHPCPSVRISDAWGRTIDLSSFGGRPLLVVYEDSGSSGQNRTLKEELSNLAAGDGYRERVALVPVADVTAYDYWPIRGFVRDAIRGESRKLTISIFCDWDGRFREELGLQRGVSNIVLYGRNGRVLLSHAGAMPESTRRELVERLKAELASAH